MRATRLPANAEPAYKTPPPQFRTAGVAAVRRIHEDLSHGRQLSGERATVVVARRIPGNRHQLFPYLRDPSGWLTQSGGGSHTQFGLEASGYDDERFGDANRIVPRDGRIECRILEVKRPSYVRATWTWHRSARDPSSPQAHHELPSTVVVPAEPQMTLHFDLQAGPKEDGLPTTIVRVTHDFVPSEWADDLAAYWRWALERADYECDLGNVRRKNPRTRLRIPAID